MGRVPRVALPLTQTSSEKHHVASVLHLKTMESMEEHAAAYSLARSLLFVAET